MDHQVDESGSDSDSSETSKSIMDMEDFDINKDTHYGQYALRKLYHESDRVIAVFYSAPTCGPCRWVKLCLGVGGRCLSQNRRGTKAIGHASSISDARVCSVFYDRVC